MIYPLHEMLGDDRESRPKPDRWTRTAPFAWSRRSGLDDPAFLRDSHGLRAPEVSPN